MLREMLGRVKMQNDKGNSVMFLCWDAPWPIHSGGALRAFNLIKQISKYYDIDLIIMSRVELRAEQEVELKRYVSRITSIATRDKSIFDLARILFRICFFLEPYHCALVGHTLSRFKILEDRIKKHNGIILSYHGHWASLMTESNRSTWILDQVDECIDVWRVYYNRASNTVEKIFSFLNYKISKYYFPKIYQKARYIISVSEEDKCLTQNVAQSGNIVVVENGVDCIYYQPTEKINFNSSKLLFTGTSVQRNMVALREFVKHAFPIVLERAADCELVVGGNFDKRSQEEFRDRKNIRFTGRVEDIRPVFRECDVFVAPFNDSHGSKLKIAEAMAIGMPIVSTAGGVRGFKLKHGESVLIAHNWQEFADMVILLLKTPDLRSSIGKNARLIADSTLAWDIIGKKLHLMLDTIKSEIQERV